MKNIMSLNSIKGLELEMLVLSFLTECLGSKRLRKGIFSIRHNDFVKYNLSEGVGVDFQVFMNGLLQLVIEVKNLWKKNRTYGIEWVKRKVLSRFASYQGVPHKFLIISYVSMLTKDALEFLRQQGITVIESGIHLVGDKISKILNIPSNWLQVKIILNQKHRHAIRNLFGIKPYSFPDNVVHSGQLHKPTTLNQFISISKDNNYYNINNNTVNLHHTEKEIGKKHIENNLNSMMYCGKSLYIKIFI